MILIRLESSANKLGPGLGAERLWSLDWRTERAVNDELRKDTESTGDTEEDGVEALLGEAVVLEEDTGVSVDVRVWVLGLSVLGENTWSDLVDLRNELEHWVVWKVLLGELALADVTWVGLAEYGVTVTWNDTTALEGGPEVVLDGLVGQVVADRLLHLDQPVEDFLVGKTVEWTGKTVQTSGEGEVWRAEGGTDQVSGVGGNVTTLVVSVDGHVESHELDKVRVLGKSELVGQVPGEVLVLLGGWDLAVLEDIAVDAGSDVWKAGDQVHRVLKGVVPVLGLPDTLGVGLGESRLTLESGDGNGELSHWVKVAWAAVDKLLDKLWKLGAGGPLGGEVADLLLRWNLTGEEKPEETLWKWLLTTWGLWKNFLALWDLYGVS